MSDLSRLIGDLCAALDADEQAVVPTLPTFETTRGNEQATDKACYSHTSHTSHLRNQWSHKNETETSENADFARLGSRASSSCVESVGSVGSVGTGAKTPAGSMSPLFPQDLEEVGSVGREGDACGRPILGLNGTASQPPERDPIPISPDQVRAAVARELRYLETLGIEGPDAHGRAVAIVRGKLHNSEALAERQVHDGRCHVCGARLDDAAPVVSVLTGRPGRHLHMHSGCHGEHVRRMAETVERIMSAAGYGAERREGDAA